MEIIIIRRYHPAGTNGRLYIGTAAKPLCMTIELPWLDNKTGISCIPEGRYRLKMRYSPRFGKHIEVTGVKGRSLILFHPANNAMKELRGCIAPVSIHTGEGKGSLSKVAFNKLVQIVRSAIDTEAVFITFKS